VYKLAGIAFEAFILGFAGHLYADNNSGFNLGTIVVEVIHLNLDVVECVVLKYCAVRECITKGIKITVEPSPSKI
jgi:hypothetical protein